MQKYKLVIDSNYFITPHYNKFTGKILNAKIKENELVDKSDSFGFIDNSDLNKKIATLQSWPRYTRQT